MSSIPKEIQQIGYVLESAGHASYLVGGCVRDLLQGLVPKDWDIATSATPETIQQLFPDSVYENAFGTVGVKTRSENQSVAVVEVTTFRTESEYSDGRHPDAIAFAATIEEDVSRRDFTVNAMAIRLSDHAGSEYDITSAEIVDPYDGQADMEQKIIRAVGEPQQRFAEDGLRLMRAVRFAMQLGFTIEHHTKAAIKSQSSLLGSIAPERIRDELVKIIMTPRADVGIYLLEELGLLQYILPELREGIGCTQNKHHIYTVIEHNVRALAYSVSKDYSLVVRLASLLHDVGKPRSKRGEGPNSTFYNHDSIGGVMTTKMLDRLHFSRDIVKQVSHLVRHHLFYYNVGEVTEAGVRRFIARVGEECIDDLFKVREADRIGSGVPKAVPYKARHLQFMIDKVRRDPISAKMLAVNGADVMRVLQITPSPRVGTIIAILLDEVLEDPTRNTKEYLEERMKEISKLSDVQLTEMTQKAKQKVAEAESGIEEEMKKKHFVQ